MTKQEVLNDIDELYKDIDHWTGEIICGRATRNVGRVRVAHWAQESLMVAAMQELSFLRDYIEENVKEAPVTWKRVKDGSHYEQVCIDEYDNGRMVLCNGDYEMDIEALLKLPKED